MAQLFANNASSSLAQPINASATSITLQSGTGARFPNASVDSGHYFLLTIYNLVNGVDADIEIVRVVNRTNDTLTVVRAQESTTARSYLAGSKVQLRLTAESINTVDAVEVRADSITSDGPINAAGQVTAAGGFAAGDDSFFKDVTVDGIATFNKQVSATMGLSASQVTTGALSTLHSLSVTNASTFNGATIFASAVSFTGDQVQISEGGTGATTAAAARTNLDVYSKSEADARYINTTDADLTLTNNLSVTGASGVSTTALTASGDFSITGDQVQIFEGGTGASTASAARVNLGTVADATANGIAVRTSENTLTARNLTSGTGISITNSDGVAGNPAISNTGVTAFTSGTGLSTNTNATGSVSVTNVDRGSAQNIFKNIANSGGTTQFSAATNADSIRFAGGGTATVTFTPATKLITISSADAFTGTVTSVNATGSNGITVTGGPVTSSGSLAISTNATSAATANTIVSRGDNGDFAAGTITAALSGNATTATTAKNLSGGTVSANSITGTSILVSGASSLNGRTVSDAVGAATIVTRDGQGFSYFNYINTNTPNAEDITLGNIFATNDTDGFLRKVSLAKVTGSLTGTAPISITGNAGTASSALKVLATATGTNSAELVRGNMADNDQFRILVGGTATNAGFAEIATADDGTEPIFVRQYTGVFTNLLRSAALLDGSGNTSFPGVITAGADMRAPVFYDSNNTAYYAAFTSNLSLRTVGAWHADSSAWTGEFSGKIQYHDNSWYLQASNAWRLRNSSGSDVVTVNQSGNVSANQFRLHNNFSINQGGSDYGQFSSWVRLDGFYGFYAPSHNSAHIYPNDVTYGSWRITGQRNGWRGIHFGDGTGMTLMMNENEFGFHREGSGWSARFTQGYGHFKCADADALDGIDSSQFMRRDADNTPTAINLFLRNNGGRISATSNYGLQAYSTGGNAAGMSFHRGGHFAVNFGLDDDNILRIGGWSAPGNLFQMDMGGNLTMAGNITAFSDARLKTNVVTVDGALAKVNALRGVTFDKDGERQLGVIAQEVEQVVPEVVKRCSDNEYLSVAYGNLAGLFIEAFKEQTAMIEQLKQQVAQLEAKLEGK
jgi:hypothetical protein